MYYSTIFLLTLSSFPAGIILSEIYDLHILVFIFLPRVVLVFIFFFEKVISTLLSHFYNLLEGLKN